MIVRGLFSIVEKSGLSSVNVICTPFWEIELCDIGLGQGVSNRALICIFDVVIEKDMKIIYE
jgi:hypothetical protein